MGLPGLVAPSSVDRIEAPVTIKAYLMCGFAAFGGIFFGYDSGYISGVKGMSYVIQTFAGLDPATTPAGLFALPSFMDSLLTSILSAGTFFGCIFAGDLADMYGRRTTIILGCGIYIVGVIIQMASTGYKLFAAGRAIAGIGAGFESAIVILYMSEIAPKAVRGALIAGYQFAITIGLLIASCVTYATENRQDSSSYRIPTGIQFLWAIILAAGLAWLPESPRYFVRKGRTDRAIQTLARLRGQPEDSEYIQAEISEIVANHEHELRVTPNETYWASWKACFHGSIWNGSSNLRRTILGTSMQMMQQFTGVNFIFYFGTTFFQQLGTIQNPFFIGLITTLVNVCSTPISFWTIERFGRRAILLWGALGMLIAQFIVAIIGTIKNEGPAVSAEIAFICIFIFFFATTWGPGAWVVIGEIFPLPIRSRGVALSTASNWLWNTIIAVITPYMVGPDKGNLGPKVFWIWGALCTGCFVYAYFLIPETKGLSLEQVDRMLEETTPRTSSKWKPHSTFSEEMAVEKQGEVVEHREKTVAA